MSQTREPVHDPFKHFKLFTCSNEKSCDRQTTSLKGVLLVLLIASISLFFYSAFVSQTRLVSCPECHKPTLNISRISQHCGVSGKNPGPTNISHIVFGIGGSSQTWKDRKQYSELWWQPNTTRGFVWLDQKPDVNTIWPENSPPCRVSSDWTQFKYTSSQSAVRLARVILDAFRVGLPNVRWFVMGDDDTVFFTDNLVSVLARYDHRQMHYIGGNSESVEQNVMHSYDTAFGGGGFAISYTLAAELIKVLDGCLDRYHNFYGSDERVSACVRELGVSVTKERGFHQVDIRGDPYGLLAAHPLAPLVSLHHLDDVLPLFPKQTQHESLRTLVQAYHVDPARTMQQCFCNYRNHTTLSASISWSVSISWGYTVQIYPFLLEAIDLGTPLQTFKTWRSWSDGPFTFNTRPVNPDPCQQPVIFHFDWVKENGNGKSLTSYKRTVVEPENKCDKADYAGAVAVERIIVSALKMDPEEWNKAPRRQCCEVSSLKNGILKMRIRSCKQWETVIA
ncbi:unnamed protein product [Ilex paraguariensis]|uniref:Uncharacterized protein n=1 Tax=Ilex paraguariensis TaxID=185542 RepID=A0ABC8QTB5_9AQUA